ncbi:MAG: DUF3099 domain-containing protein [Actinomycetales bacterium]
MSRATREPVYSVSGVRRGTSDDLAQRQRRYLISMSIRTVSFVLAVVTHGPLRWIFVAAALILPYIAVVMANAVGSGSVPAPTPYVPQQAALDTARRQAIEHPPYGAAPAGDEQPDQPTDQNTGPEPAAS